VLATGAVISLDFDGMSTGKGAYLCVREKDGGKTYKSSGSSVAISNAVVSISGDPHVRKADGHWVDFFGESGVYQLLDGELAANAKLGYAVRDNFMIWHPQVMRPGTLVEEVGIQLKDTKASVRLGIQGGGIVSVRIEDQSTEFWAPSDERSLKLGAYTITWRKCVANCDVTMPWGTHQRTHSLSVQGRGDFIQVFMARSGGYRFVDIEAIPADGATGLLADASFAPTALSKLLVSGGEATYKAVDSSMLL